MKHSKIATYIYIQQLKSKQRLSKKFWTVLRNFVVKFICDFPVRLEAHNRLMLMPLSHQLPNFQNSFPLYDTLPKKIAQFLHDEQNNITCIDVGANIGDTISAFHISDDDKFLAIEPSKKFTCYLKENLLDYKNITHLSVLCSSNSTKDNYKIEEKNGTAQIQKSDQGEEIPQLMLDEIIENNPTFRTANILKIDTDGYDLKVILGAKKIINTSTPVILFECDAFSNSKYIEEFMECTKIFIESGYKSILVYDNFGHYFGKFSFDNPDFRTIFTNLLRWQQASRPIYFDILLLHGELAEKFENFIHNQIH